MKGVLWMRYLLNKEAIWLEFRCEWNECLEVTAQEEVWYTGQRPFGYTNLTDFLERRKAPKHRAYIVELLCQCGCQELDGYLDVTYALSLSRSELLKKSSSFSGKSCFVFLFYGKILNKICPKNLLKELFNTKQLENGLLLNFRFATAP